MKEGSEERDLIPFFFQDGGTSGEFESFFVYIFYAFTSSEVAGWTE